MPVVDVKLFESVAKRYAPFVVLAIYEGLIKPPRSIARASYRTIQWAPRRSLLDYERDILARGALLRLGVPERHTDDRRV